MTMPASGRSHKTGERSDDDCDSDDDDDDDDDNDTMMMMMMMAMMVVMMVMMTHVRARANVHAHECACVQGVCAQAHSQCGGMRGASVCDCAYACLFVFVL